MFICDTCAKYALWQILPVITVPYTGTVHRIVKKVLNDRISTGQKMFKSYVLNNISYQRNTYLLRPCPSKIKRHTKFLPLELEARSSYDKCFQELVTNVFCALGLMLYLDEVWCTLTF